MKLLKSAIVFILFVVFVAATPAKAQIAYRQSASKLGFPAGSSAALAYSASNQAGDLLLCYIESYGGSGTISSVTDSNGNTWSPVFNSSSNNFNQPVALFYAYNASAGANTVTVHFTAGVSTGGVYVYEYSGVLSTANPLDVAAVNSIASATAISVSVNTSASGDLLFSPLSLGNHPAITPPSGYALRVSQTYDFGADLIGTNTAGAYTATWATASATGMFAGLAAFKPAPASAPGQISYRQSASKLGFPAGSSAALAYSASNQAGDLLLCYIESYGGSGTISSVTDSNGNTWSPVFNSSSNNFNQPVALFYAYNVSAGTNTVTVHFTAGVSTGGVYVYEYSGVLSTANPLDVAAVNSIASATAISVSVNTSASGDLLFSPLSLGNHPAITPPSGYALRVSQTYDFGADLIGTNTAGAYTATWGAASATGMFVGLAAFKPAAGGTGGGSTLSSIAVNPTSVTGGNSATGTATLTAPAPSGGAVVTLSSTNGAVAAVPTSVTVNANATTANFTVNTSSVASSTQVTISGTYGATATASLTVQPSSTSSSALPQINWRLVSVDTQETGCDNNAAVNAFDGSSATIWHSWWCNGPAPALPHQMTIDLGATYDLTGFQYLPRQDGCANGWIKNYEFDVSVDGNSWTIASSGVFNYSGATATCPGASTPAAFNITFGSVQGRYVRLQALSEVNGHTYASAAEINVISSDAGASSYFTMSPRVATITTSQTQQFNAGSSNVNWMVDGVPGGNSTVGTVNSSGLYTPPNSAGTHNIYAVSTSNALVFGRGTVNVENVASMTMHHNDVSRTGQNLNEIGLTPLNTNQVEFGKLFSYSVDGQIYGQPLYVANVNVAGKGTHNVLYVVTEHDSVYAFDADGNPATPLWQTSFINPGAGITTVPSGDVYDNGVSANIGPEIGITSTPVIDTSAGTIFVVAVTKENGNWVHRLHALDITSGAERSNSPVQIQATVPGTGYDNVNGQVNFSSRRQLQRPGLLLLNGLVYITFGSYADIDPYHGWIFAYNESSLQRTYVYNVSPNGTEAAIWQSGTGPSADASGNIYVMSGTGLGTAQGNSFLKLSPSLQVLDYMTPYNQSTLDANDLDLGSGGALLLPDQSTGPTHLLVGAGKEGRVYVINRDNMGHANSTDQVVQELPGAVGPPNPTPGNAAEYGTPALWNNLVYFIADADNAKAFQLTNGLLSSTPVAASKTVFNWPGSTPSISANGNTNGILWAIDGSGPEASYRPALLHAYDASNISHELYNSAQAANGRDTMPLGVKFTVPTVVNGKVYVGTQTQLVVFGRLLP